MRHFTKNDRITTSVALLASLAWVFWPALAVANCCCKRADFFGFDTVETASAPTCCSGNSCCSEPASSLPQSCFSTSTDCSTRSLPSDCECDHCHASNELAVSQTVREITPNAPATPAPDWIAFSSREPTVSQTSFVSAHLGEKFLTAQDHCALHCRWLK